MATSYSITEMFGKNLAELLSGKILQVYPSFKADDFIRNVKDKVVGKSYTERIGLIAEQLKNHLPEKYEDSLPILLSVLGEENPNQTGMFTHYYWVMPIGKFIADNGLQHYTISMKGIEEITKRNTGEYAVRPFIRKYPEQALKTIKCWALSPNFHLRRLASEGLRPKLPWAPKLDTFLHNPDPVFRILDILKEDEIMFVKKSVANHLTDWIKVNPNAAEGLIKKWEKSANTNTQWILKRATRKMN